MINILLIKSCHDPKLIMPHVSVCDPSLAAYLDSLKKDKRKIAICKSKKRVAGGKGIPDERSPNADDPAVKSWPRIVLRPRKKIQMEHNVEPLMHIQFVQEAFDAKTQTACSSCHKLSQTPFQAIQDFV